MSNEERKQFYRARSQKPKLYGYDDEGNLVEKNKEGTVLKTIPLPTYRPPTFEEYDAMEKKRSEEIAVATKKVNDARKRLRELHLRPDRSMSEIMIQNRNVEQADLELQYIRFPLRYIAINKPGEIEVRQYDLTRPQEKRKNAEKLVFLETRPYTLQDQYVRVGEAPKKPLVSVAQAKEQAAKNVPVVLFWEPETNDNGFLSLSWAVELEWKGTRYHSAKQAIYAELARAFQDQAHLERILAAETADAVQYSLEDVPGDIGANEVKWNDTLKRLLYDINLYKFKQYPELALRLLQTQQAMLGAYLPQDNLLGIGLSLDNIQAQNPVNWTGQNWLGKALMDIRQQLQIEQQEKEQAAQAAIQAASAPALAPAAAAPAVKPRRRFQVPIGEAPKAGEGQEPPRTIRRAPSVRFAEAQPQEEEKKE